MHGILLDTHAAVWYLAEPEKLSAPAVTAIDEALSKGFSLFVSAISLVEIVYLGEKGRINAEAAKQLIDTLSDDSVFTIVPIDISVVHGLNLVPRKTVPDMPDRIIAATGAVLKVALVTRDQKLTAAQIPTIW